ncbi:LOW QUALITY PROTEIN: hypothetical protein T265_12885 [Opisthorchis viverrini]|uniref:EB domain-containing protein n=1 Tax=Opisthorchis viverrini TaxID=6198 RepID=A0A075A882_OPIVI|nr:LOW QUALITY PROTEIN: hypothetical protein T265_12885 [Opisthorchis viverrini]KER31930.1 LOW QUALITY PROTEIN: hypothetical protein T265_12885 [Opisthorchis viverrini]
MTANERKQSVLSENYHIQLFLLTSLLSLTLADQFHVVSPGPCLHEGDSFCTRRVANSMCSREKNECFCKPGYVAIQEIFGLTCKTRRCDPRVMIYLNPNWTVLKKYTHLRISLVFTRDSTESLAYDIPRLNVLHTCRLLARYSRYCSIFSLSKLLARLVKTLRQPMSAFALLETHQVGTVPEFPLNLCSLILLSNLKCQVDNDCVHVTNSVCHPGAGYCACPSGTIYVPQQHSCCEFTGPFFQRLTWNPAESLVYDVFRQLNVVHQAASCFSRYDIRDIAIHIYFLETTHKVTDNTSTGFALLRAPSGSAVPECLLT